MRIAYQGEPGAFSEAAARRVDPDAQLVPCRSFDEVFDAVQAGTSAYGVLPIENSIGGSIHRNYDLLVERTLPIVGEVELPVIHHLLALPGRDPRRTAARLFASAGARAVRAVPPHADQRRDHRHLRHRRQRQDGRRRGLKDAGAIASARAGARSSAWSRSPSSVQDIRRQPSPRFLVVGTARRCRIAVADKTSIVFSCPTSPGRLFKALSDVCAARHLADQARIAADPGPRPWE
jgi:prephenate dehydratase